MPTNNMDLHTLCRELPKAELHAHLNGSLSPATLLELKRLLKEKQQSDNTNVLVEEFQISPGDSKSLSDCFQIFKIAHALTSTPEALSLATTLTLQEFQDDGCCYIELRSTPRDTPHMTRRKYIETIIGAIQKASTHLSIISSYIVSIDRRFSLDVAKQITDLAIEYHNKYPDVIVGLELSGDPTVGQFQDFIPYFTKARENGLKITFHCGEVPNEQEVLHMLNFRPDRIGHGTCIHPGHGGTDATWALLCKYKIPVEICMTSNVKCKISADYESHHFWDMLRADVPTAICTDDKGVFATSLSGEYKVCGSRGIIPEQLVRLSLHAASFVFRPNTAALVRNKIQHFIDTHSL